MPTRILRDATPAIRRAIAAAAAIASLVACGAEDGATRPSGGDPEPGAAAGAASSLSGLEGLAEKARSEYSGVTSAATLTMPVAGRILESLIAGPTSTRPGRREGEAKGIHHAGVDGLAGLRSAYPLDIVAARRGPPSRRPRDPYDPDGPAEPEWTEAECRWSGSWALDDGDTAGPGGGADATGTWNRSYVLDECTRSSRDWTMTGRIEIGRDAADSPRWSFVGYDEVLFSGEGRRLLVTGTVFDEATAFCGGGPTETTLLVRDLDTGEERLLDGLMGRRGPPGPDDDYCLGRTVMRHDWTGRVFLGDSGYVDVNTPSPPALNADHFAAPGGHVALSGANGTRAALRLLPLEGVRHEFAPLPESYARLDVTGADGATRSVASTVEAVREGALADLEDRDGDGLPDSYERLYGLDPANPADASRSDEDGDGLTALQEFTELGDPTGEIGPGEAGAVDVDVTVSLEIDPGSGEQRLRPTVTLDASRWAASPVGRTYRLELEGGEWLLESLSGTCTPVDDDASTDVIECTVEPGTEPWAERVTVTPAIGRSDADGELRVGASILSPDFAGVHPAHTGSAIVDYQRRPSPGFTIDAPEAAFGDAHVVSRLALAIAQPRQARAIDARLSAEVPAGVEMLSARLSRDGSDGPARPCTLGSTLVCTIASMRTGDAFSLELEYLVLGPGQRELVWHLGAPTEPDTPTTIATTAVHHRNSMVPLQALIDAAADGDTVTLPPGTYLGTLHGRGKELHVTGATGDERTTLLSVDAQAPILTATGRRSVWSNIDWRTTGAPLVFPYGSDLTISDSTIEPVPDLPHVMNELLPRWSTYRLHANRIANFGRGGGECAVLVRAGDRGYSRGSTYLQHNLFLDNDCDTLIRFGEDRHVVRSNLIANNNTFVGPGPIVRVSLLGSEGDGLRFRNNVVSGAYRIIELPASRFGVSEDRRRLLPYGVDTVEPMLISSSNVVWNSAMPAALPTDWRSHPYIEVDRPDLMVEPRFVDATGGDYRLLPDSALIDAGVRPDDYVWDFHDAANEDRRPGPDATTRAVDGDGDGAALPDIGAFEFRP